MKHLLIITSILATGFAAQAQTVLTDTFDVPPGTAAEFNLQSNQVVRQAGSAVSVTYTNVGASIIGATQEYLSQTEGFETNGVVVLRGLCNGDGSPSIAAPSIAINEDLAPQLAEKHYSIYYTGVMIDRLGNISTNSESLDSWYQSVMLGGAGLPLDPQDANCDLGFLMRSDGIAQVWGDGNLLSAVTVSNFTLLEPYTMYLDINESNSTVKASVICAGIVTDLPLAPITFEAGETARRFQLSNRLSVIDFNDPANWDAWADAQVNDLQIDLITTPVIEEYIITDTYTVSSDPIQNFDLQANQAARQLGSTINASYVDVSANITAATQVYLTQVEAYDGSGVLNLRGLIDANNTAQIAATAVAFNEDLSPWLASEKYSISFTGVMIDRAGGTATNSTYIESWYQSFSMNGGATLPPDPTNPSTDLGFRMRYMGIAEIWGDGTLLTAVGVTNFTLTQPYTVTINMNEAGGTATASVEIGGVVTDLPGPFPVNFEAGETNRNFHFMNRVFSYDTQPQNPGWDVWVDAQVNDLKISIIRDKSYETWVLVDTSLTEGVNDGRTDDPDSDDMDNLLEYALGGNPLVDDAAALLPKFSLPDPVTVEYVYRRRSDADERGLAYDVFLNSAGLNSPWSNVSNSLETATAPIGSDFESVTNELDITGLPLSFLTLKVTED